MANSNIDDPSTFPVPPIPPVGSQSYPGGAAYDPTVPSPADWGAPSTGSGVSGASIAKALSDLSASLKQTGGGDSSVPQHGPAPVGSAQSGTGQGSASGINALVQMLMQNQNKYFPGGPNTQPVAQGRQAGLLGF